MEVVVHDQPNAQGWKTEHDTQQRHKDWESPVRKERPDCVAEPAARLSADRAH